MSLQQTLDTMSSTLQRASSLPLSASCVVNRVDMLTLVEEARGSVPREMRAATNVLAHRDQLLSGAQAEAARTVQEAQAVSDELVATSAIAARAHRQAAEILQDAREEAARLLRDADDYCEQRLAAFEDDLSAAIAQVRRGRDRLRSRMEQMQADVADVVALDSTGPDLVTADAAGRSLGEPAPASTAPVAAQEPTGEDQPGEDRLEPVAASAVELRWRDLHEEARAAAGPPPPPLEPPDSLVDAALPAPPSELAASEVGASEVGALEAGALEVGALEVEALDVEAPESCAPEADAPEADAPETDAETDVTEVETAHDDGPEAVAVPEVLDEQDEDDVPGDDVPEVPVSRVAEAADAVRVAPLEIDLRDEPTGPIDLRDMPTGPIDLPEQTGLPDLQEGDVAVAEVSAPVGDRAGSLIDLTALDAQPRREVPAVSDPGPSGTQDHLFGLGERGPDAVEGDRAAGRALRNRLFHRGGTAVKTSRTLAEPEEDDIYVPGRGDEPFDQRSSRNDGG